MLCGCVVGTLTPSHRAWADGVVLPLPAADQKEITAQLGPGVVGQALPSKPIEDASQYFPLQERALAYRITAGKNAGTHQTLHVAKGQRPNGRPAWRFGLTPSLDGFIQQTAEGDLIMPAVSDSDEGVVIVTTPPSARSSRLCPGDCLPARRPGLSVLRGWHRRA
jgi:hypothetical protein